jgi:hypothetical protein
VSVPATDGELALPFTVGAQGAGSVRTGEVAITEGAGTLVLEGETLPAIVYEQQPFFDYVLYQTLAVAPDRWWIVWLYCRNGELVWVYSEATDGTPIDYEAATGTCDELAAASSAHAVLPASTLDPLPLLGGYAVDGPQIHLDGTAPGTVTLAGLPLAFHVFGEVDCTQDCGTPGWRELHGVLWDEAGMRACFAILYLFDSGDPMLMTYSLTLPDLSDPAGETELEGSWTEL